MASPALPGPQHPIPFRTALRVWLRIGLNSFGGPAGQIAVMHRVLVEELRWISPARFLHALNYCMLLPGPEAQQLTVYIGWLLHRTRGGLAAGILFVLPGLLAMLALSWTYAAYGQVGFIAGLFFGLKPAVLAIVVEAVLRIGRKTLRGPGQFLLAALAFVAIACFRVPFPWVVLAAGVAGLAGWKWSTKREPGSSNREPESDPPESVVDTLLEQGLLEHTRPSYRKALQVLVLGLTVWFVPLLLAGMVFGWDSVYVRSGLFFSQTAVVTFGGAYAALAHVARQAVEHYGWLQSGEMLDGLGLAETTPGPLILVLQFVGFLGAYRQPGTLEPWMAGILGALISVWVTFVPCFLWIFLGGPFIESLRSNRALSSALSSISAAVVGVILSLAVWFALHTLFGSVQELGWLGLRLEVPVWHTWNPASTGIAVLALALVFVFRRGLLMTLALCAVLGAGLQLSLG